MKKTCIAVLIGAMVMSLVACGSSSSSSSETTTAAATEAATEAELPVDEAAEEAEEREAEAAAPTTDFPTGAITLLVPATPGGSFDMGVRMLLPYVEDILGTTINVVNDDGGSGWVNYLGCYNAEPDGYSLYCTNIPAFFSCYDPDMGRTQRWDDYAYICNFCTDNNILITRADSGIETFEDFYNYCMDNQDVVINVTVSAGDDHIAYLKMINALPELTEHMSPLHSNSIMSQELLGGFLDFVVANVGNLASLGDQVVPLCIFSEERDPLAPDIPTFNEECAKMGKDVDVVACVNRGLIMPKDVPDDVQDIIRSAFVEAMNNPDLKQEYLDNSMGWNLLYGDEYTDMIQEEDEYFKTYIMPLLGWD